jgi:hypothetical protein
MPCLKNHQNNIIAPYFHIFPKSPQNTNSNTCISEYIYKYIVSAKGSANKQTVSTFDDDVACPNLLNVCGTAID